MARWEGGSASQGSTLDPCWHGLGWGRSFFLWHLAAFEQLLSRSFVFLGCSFPSLLLGLFFPPSSMPIDIFKLSASSAPNLEYIRPKENLGISSPCYSSGLKIHSQLLLFTFRFFLICFMYNVQGF